MISLGGRGKRFDWFAAYLLGPERDTGPDRVAWIAVRNLPSEDPELAAAFMRATAARNVLSQKPLYHLTVGFAPEDGVDRAVMERVADRVLERLGLAEHEAFFVAHRDRRHPHVHVIVNLVHPETGKVQPTWNDWQRAGLAFSEERRALGLPQMHKFVTRADVAHDLRTYERVVSLTEEHYRAQLAASAARARSEQLEFAAERARTTLERCDQAFGAVYRNPQDAYQAYLKAVDERGLSQTAQLMLERPGQFGGLIAVERRRAFGLLQVADEGAARAAVPGAAAAAREAVDALRAWRNAAEAVARAVDQAFERELAGIYREPGAARTAFERLALEHRTERASAAIREGSAALGPLFTPARQHPGRLSEQAARAVARGLEALQARAAAQGPMPTPHADVTLALSRSEADSATRLERAIRTELRTLPEQTELKRRLTVAAGRLFPQELHFLRAALTAPQWAILAQLKKSVRDIALGRGEPDQSRE